MKCSPKITHLTISKLKVKLGTFSIYSFVHLIAENNKTQVNSNMVKENGENCPDGADEKMLAEDEKKIAVKTDHADVKFVSGDQQNGDTKIDILEIKQVN